MLFPKDDTTGRDLCVGFCKRRATGKPEIRISDAPKGLFLRGARMAAPGAFLWLGKFGMGKCRCFNSASLRTPGQALLRLVVSKLRSLGRPALADLVHAALRDYWAHAAAAFSNDAAPNPFTLRLR
jgi:hypothetical protein